MSTKSFVIVTYDVVAKRNSKVLKTCRRTLNHVQKSVFEGFLNEKQLIKLQNELQKLIDPDDDQIAIYRFLSNGKVEKYIIGYRVSQDNII